MAPGIIRQVTIFFEKCLRFDCIFKLFINLQQRLIDISQNCCPPHVLSGKQALTAALPFEHNPSE
jgi:hypothetical protein